MSHNRKAPRSSGNRASFSAFIFAKSALIHTDVVPIPVFLCTGGFYSLYFAHSNEVMRYAFYLSVLPEIAQSHSQ